jgi:hypothetical protein
MTTSGSWRDPSLGHSDEGTDDAFGVGIVAPRSPPAHQRPVAETAPAVRADGMEKSGAGNRKDLDGALMRRLFGIAAQAQPPSPAGALVNGAPSSGVVRDQDVRDERRVVSGVREKGRGEDAYHCASICASYPAYGGLCRSVLAAADVMAAR